MKLYCQVLLWLYLYGQAISFIISLTLVTGTAKILLEYIKRTELLCDTMCKCISNKQISFVTRYVWPSYISLFITSSTLMESSEFSYRVWYPIFPNKKSKMCLYLLTHNFDHGSILICIWIMYFQYPRTKNHSMKTFSE